MTLRYIDGTAKEAVLLARSGQVMRVAPQGAEDTLVLSLIGDTWVSDDCEPVQVQFAWEKAPLPGDVDETDCICAPERAARLVRHLYAGEEEPATACAAGISGGSGLVFSEQVV